MSTGIATVTAKSGLNVRAGAGTKYAKIGGLSNGTRVNYSAEKNGWLQIKYGGKTGYISKQYTSITQAASAPAASNASSNTQSASKTVVITASALNVRRGPGTNNAVVGTLYNGNTAQVYGESNGWLKIKFKNQDAWISAKYTKTQSGNTASKPATDSKPAQSTESGTSVSGKYTVTANSLNVRSGAGTSHSKIGSLSYGTVVETVEQKGGWFKIKYQGSYGWVSGDYLQKGTSAVPAVEQGSGKLRGLTTKQVASIETGRKAKTLVDLATGKRFNVSWDACATYHSDCTPMTQSDTDVMKSLLSSRDPNHSDWKKTSSWTWDAREGAIKLKDGGWVACGFHTRPHAAIMGGKPGYPFSNQSNTRPAGGWPLGGHFCLYYGDSPGGTPKCNDKAKSARGKSV